MKIFYKNNLKKAYMILENEEEENEDYQIAMLKENDVEGLLKTEVRYMDNQNFYHYDISGKTSFQTLYEKMNLKQEEMERLVTNLLQTIQNTQKYMLDANCILLEPEFIFSDEERYCFCYYPPCATDLKHSFHRLTEFFVRKVSYSDKEAVHFAYTMHKMTMEENYSVEEILHTLLSDDEEESVMNYDERMEYMMSNEDHVEEKNDLWEPVRKLLEKAKRRRMGYAEEDL